MPGQLFLTRLVSITRCYYSACTTHQTVRRVSTITAVIAHPKAATPAPQESASFELQQIHAGLDIDMARLIEWSRENFSSRELVCLQRTTLQLNQSLNRLLFTEQIQLIV